MGEIIDLSVERANRRRELTPEERRHHLLEAAKWLCVEEDAHVNREYHLRILGMLAEKGVEK